MMINYEHEIPMGHRLMNHEGKCRFLHGHNYRVKVTISGPINYDTGMVMDFSRLKEGVRKVLSHYDHAFVLFEGDKVLQDVDHTTQNIIYIPEHPTAEQLAKHWGALLRLEFEISPMVGKMHLYVAVQETRDCWVNE